MNNAEKNHGDNDRGLPVAVYSPESRLLHPRQLLRSMWRDLLASRELAWRLLVRNISALYRQTIFGYIWAFLPPIVTTLTFVLLNSQNILAVAGTGIPYPAYVMIGTLLWQCFADALRAPLQVMNQSMSFIVKINFPREALLLAGAGEVIFNFIVRLVLMVIVYILYRIPVPSTVILAPIGICALMALGFMLGILLIPIGVLYRDVEKGLPIVTTMWMLLTPVVYPPSAAGHAPGIMRLNPITPLLITAREMMIGGHLTQLTAFSWVGGITFGLMLTGWILYKLAFPHLIERISE